MGALFVKMESMQAERWGGASQSKKQQLEQPISILDSRQAHFTTKHKERVCVRKLRCPEAPYQRKQSIVKHSFAIEHQNRV